MTSADRDALRQLFNVAPSIASDDGGNGAARHAELFSEVDRRDLAKFVSALNFSNLVLGQYRHIAPGRPLRARLKACCVSVDHLFTHGGELEVLRAIVMAVAVLMVNGHAVRYWSDEVRVHEAVHQELLAAAVVSSGQLDAHIARAIALEHSSGLAPITSEPAHSSLVAYFVQPLISANWFPHDIHRS